MTTKEMWEYLATRSYKHNGVCWELSKLQLAREIDESQARRAHMQLVRVKYPKFYFNNNTPPRGAKFRREFCRQMALRVK